MKDKRQTMRRNWIITVLWVAGLLAAAMPLAAQDDEMRLPGAGAALPTRPAVVFPHSRHADRLDCTRCHHDYDANGNNVGGDGQPCAACHSPAAETNPVPLMRAYHLQCRGCHREALADGQGSPPVMCGQCHRRTIATR